MFWADQASAEIEKTFPGKKKFIIRDEKTPSGRVHVGSLRGVIIHGIAAQALAEKGHDVTYYYEINDADPMDGLPTYLSKNFEKYMGRPLKDVPPPDKNGEPDEAAFAKNPENNYANYFGDEFVEVIHKLGFKPVIYKNSTQYRDGKYDKWIDIVLEHPEEIRAVYKEVSGSEKGEEWNAVQVVCEKCGRVGTTTVVGSSGKSGEKIVEYICEPEKVKWARGCGYKGETSPYGGRGKLPWKVEWAAKWQIFPVDIEGAGKDHGTFGGSRDVAAGIVKKVLKGQVPFDIPYEFFLFAGAKMSSSKAVGASAKEVANTLPPELLRFLMARAWPHQSIDFDPSGDTIPRLYDKYDEAHAVFFGHAEVENSEDIKRAYHFSQMKPEDAQDLFLPRFSRVIFIMQIPSLDFWEEMEELKGSKLTPEEKNEAQRRRQYAQQWLSDYAPEQAKFEIQKTLPACAHELSAQQKAFLKEIVQTMKQNPRLKGDELHGKLHELKKTSGLDARVAFGAIYAALLGKDSGPQAGWFLDAMEHDFVIERLQEVAALPAYEKPAIADAVSPYAIIRKEVCEKFPGIKLGFNVINGVTIVKTHKDFSALQQKLLAGLDFEDLKKNSPRLEGFRDIYRGFGVKPSTNRPSPVMLVTRLANGKTLPSINVAVDIYNTLAVKHQLAIGLFDLDKITLPIELKFAQGGEMFHGLGQEKAVPLNKGELCYFDAKGIVMARDFNYLDSELTKVDEKTTNILLNIDGNQNCSANDVRLCLDELEARLQQYCGGKTSERAILSVS